MNSSEEIKGTIAVNNEIRTRLYSLIIELDKENEELGRELLIVRYLESTKLRNNYLKRFGIQDEADARSGDKRIVFTRSADFVKTVDVRKEFDSFQGFEDWLKNNKLYAHAASSFCDRPDKWYSWSLKQQLENLSWEFNEKGYLINTAW